MGSQKASNWSITINNPTAEDYAEIEALKVQPWVKKWEGQLEEGEDGTPHIQARLHTERCRFGRVKTALSRAHIEAARNSLALTNYVHKPETRIAELPTVASRFMNIQQFYPILAAWTVDKIAEDYHESAEDVRIVFKHSTIHRGFENRVNEWKAKYKPLELVQQCAALQIQQGALGLEYIITNPATKTMFKTFFWDIIVRSS